MHKSTFKSGLRPALFWDVDFNDLDVDRAVRLVIERICSEGNLDEFFSLFEYYGRDLIADKVIEAGYFDNKTLNYLSLVLSLPKTKFKCYMKKQSCRGHWNY